MLRTTALALLLIVNGLFGLPQAAAVKTCTELQKSEGLCPVVTVDDEKVTLGIEQAEENPPVAGPGAQANTNTATQTEEIQLRFNCPRVQRECWPLYYDIDPGDAADTAVTASDFVSFRPASGVAHMQPNGFAVVGRHSNFYAEASAHTRTGTLLGEPASALFTPVGYRWDYGDGSSRTVTVKGGTWASLGLADFDPTPASHVYTQRGSYTINLTVYYAIQARYADDPDWWGVPGLLAVAAPPLTTTVYTAKTVLVERSCAQDPSGPGC